MINVKLSGAARTSLLTLRARSEEHKREDSILDDSWSADWYEHAPKQKDYDKWYNPTFQLATAIRSRIMDEMTSEFIESHELPLVVELGAGLSTRYYRIGKGVTRWVELDLAEAISVRRKIDVESDNHWFLRADMTDPDWMHYLPESDAKNTLFISEGAMMFADSDGIKRMISAMREQYKGAQFIFDVVDEHYRERLSGSFEDMDAPIQWSASEKELKKLGLNIQEKRHLLLEHQERWLQIGVAKEMLTEERSGYVVKAVIK